MCFVPKFGKGPYHGDAPSHALPLGVNRNDPLPLLPPFVYCNRIYWELDLMLILTIIMHRKPVPKIQKSSPSWEGDTPSYTLPLMSNTLLNNRKTVSPTPLYWNCYTFSAIIDVNLNFMMHKNLNLVLRFPKSPHPPPWCPLSNTLLNNRNGSPSLYCNHKHWELVLMLIKTLQATKNLALVPQNPKTSPHPPLCVKYIILNIQNSTPPPLYCNHYILQ